MSSELDQKTITASANASPAALIGAPIGTTTAGDMTASGSLRGEGAEQDHITDSTIRPVDLQGHGLDVGSLPTAAMIDRADTVDPPSAIDHPAVAAAVQQGVSNATGTAVHTMQNSDQGIQKSGPSSADPHIAPISDSHSNHTGQLIAHQFDVLIAGAMVADQTEGLPAATPHHTNASDSGMIGGLDRGGLDLGGATHATTGASAGIAPIAFGNDNPLAEAATADGGQTHWGSFSALSELVSDVGTQDVSADRTASPSDPSVANGLAPINTDTADGGSISPPSPNPDSGNEETTKDTKGDASTPVDHNAVDKGSAAPIVPSGAAFWTVAVDHLDGSGHPSMPVYTAGNDMSFGSLAAAHPDDLHTLTMVLGVR